MKKFLCLMFLLLSATAARADIDQTCLRQCTTSGAPGTCMTQCSYGPSALPPKPVQAAPQALSTTHDVMNAPIPIAQGAVMPQKPPAPPAPVKDYTCFNSCLHDAHSSYGWCEQRCSRPACPPGGIMCGVQAPGQSQQPPGGVTPAGTAAPAFKPPVPPTR